MAQPIERWLAMPKIRAFFPSSRGTEILLSGRSVARQGRDKPCPISVKLRRIPVGAGVGLGVEGTLASPSSLHGLPHGRRKRPLPSSQPPPPLRDDSPSLLVFLTL